MWTAFSVVLALGVLAASVTVLARRTYKGAIPNNAGAPLNGFAQPAGAASSTIIVNSTDDTANPSDGKCTLREAITAANTQTASGAVAGECAAGSTNSIISFDSATFGTGPGAKTINLTGALPAISSNVTINGPGSDLLTVRRYTGGDYRILLISSGTVSISGMTVTNGKAPDGAPGGNQGRNGGGISNLGTLTLTDVTVSANSTGSGTGNPNSGFAAGGGAGGGIYNSGTLTMTSCTITGNYTGKGGSAFIEGGNGGDGGGLFNNSSVTMTDCTVSGNLTATPGGSFQVKGGGGRGGGLYSSVGSIGMTNVRVSNNKTADGSNSGGNGGGMLLASGFATLTNCTVNDNSTGVTDPGPGFDPGTGFGGGIFSLAALTVTGSTFYGNAGAGGSAIDSELSLNITNCTFTGNHGYAGFFSGAVTNGGTMTMTSCTITANDHVGLNNGSVYPIVRNTIVAGNGADDDYDVTGLYNSQGYNLIGKTCLYCYPSGFGVTGDQVGVTNAQLAPLADNGGPTQTIALRPNSPAIDKGKNFNSLATDQRGLARTFIDPTITAALGGDHTDIGAVEMQPPGASTSLSVGLAHGAYGGTVTLTATLTSGNSSLAGQAVSFTLNGASAGSATTNSQGIATLSNVSLSGINGGTYAPGANQGVSATFGGGVSLFPSNGSNILTVDKASATVTPGNLSHTYDGNPKSATATTNPAGLNVTFTYDGSSTSPVNAGIYTVVANINDVNYQGSATSTLLISKANQTITFGALPNKTYGDSPVTLSATASSSLSVSFSVFSGPATISGNTLRITGPGVVTVRGSQAGNSNYSAAPPVDRAFTVAKASTTTTVTSSVNPASLNQNTVLKAAVTSTAGTPTGTVQFQDNGGNLGSVIALGNDGSASFSTAGLAPGTHVITAIYGGDSNFTSSAGTLSGGQIVQAPPAISTGDATVTQGTSGTVSASFIVALSASSALSITVDYQTVDGTARAGHDYQGISGATLTFLPGETTHVITILVNGETEAEQTETFFVNLSNPVNATISRAQATGTILNTNPPLPTVQFSNVNFDSSEGDGQATITVTRTGNLSNGASVDYATSDGTASQRNKYIAARGTLNFAANEASKTFAVLLIDDSYADGDKFLNLSLSNPQGATVGPQSTAILIIRDNDTSTAATNPLEGGRFFAREQYLDFLGRVPETSGWNDWSNYVDGCAATDYQCQVDRRVTASAGFFRSPEFFSTGYFVMRIYRATLYPRPQQGAPPHPTYDEFLHDGPSIHYGVAGDTLAASKLAFAQAWVQRSDFLTMYPASMTTGDFIDKLAQTAGVTLSQTDRTALLGLTRAEIVIAIVDNPQVDAREYNAAFVTMQYMGYLRRQPEDQGYHDWLTYLDANPQNCGVMIYGFSFSREYRERFGLYGDSSKFPSVSPNVTDCGH